MHIRTAVAVILGSTVAASAADAQVTQRVSIQSNGLAVSTGGGSLSPNGRFVQWGDGTAGVYVRDRFTGITEEIFPSLSGKSYVVLTPDRRFAAFMSEASTIVPGDTNFVNDVFVLDRALGVTVRASVTMAGLEAHGESSAPAITPDGRYVAFISRASDLVPGDTNGAVDVFVRDLVAGTTERVSVDSSGTEGDRSTSTFAPVISPDGRYVAFQGLATNLVPGATAWGDVYLRDRTAGTLECVSLGSSNQPIGGNFRLSMTPDARFVAFDSIYGHQVYVRDRQTATTEMIGVSTGGQPAAGWCDNPSISSDGRCVAFHTLGDDLTTGESGGWQDVYVRDRLLGTTERVSGGLSGAQADSHSGEGKISEDGRCVLFQSYASNLVPEGGIPDHLYLYVHDRLGGPAFTSLCGPGANGVIACPCGNPPSGTGRGCQNSAGTGGAILSAAGGTIVSSDSLVFTTSGEKPTATSILLQGTTSQPNGSVYGQGVRCVGGTLKRLYTKTASGGSITAPNFAAGDPTVTSRSAAKGSPISAGQSRWYLVFYRDPIVLGGCPATSTFNATQSGRIEWSP